MELDVSDFRLGGEWLGINLETKKKEERKITLLIKPMSDKDGIEIAQLADKKDEKGKADLIPFIDRIKDYVLDWKIKSGGEPLPCNDKTKKEFLPFICGMPLKGEAERVEKERLENEKIAKEENKGLKKDDRIEPKKVFRKSVGMSILEFAQNFDNFIKN